MICTIFSLPHFRASLKPNQLFFFSWDVNTYTVYVGHTRLWEKKVLGSQATTIVKSSNFGPCSQAAIVGRKLSL